MRYPILAMLFSFCMGGCATTQTIPPPNYTTAFSESDVAALPTSSVTIKAGNIEALRLVSTSNTVKTLRYIEACRQSRMRDGDDVFDSMLGSNQKSGARGQSDSELLIVYLTEELRKKVGKIYSDSTFSDAVSNVRDNQAVGLIDISAEDIGCTIITVDYRQFTSFIPGKMTISLLLISPEVEKICESSVTIDEARFGRKVYGAWNISKAIDAYFKWGASEFAISSSSCLPADGA